ncbi:MAG TPA: hypothetical protein VFN97_09960 [Actinospica sp.]|nr:hypothetical protein [Actinospica sp.]
MSTLTALARARAATGGRAVPITAVRHVHLSDEPLVLIPLMQAGEAAAPLALMAGTDRSAPRLLLVAQPRNRDQRFDFLTAFAELLVPYIGERRQHTETVEATKNHEEWERCTDAPQLILPNTGGVEALRLLGRSARFRTTDGPYPVDPRVPLLGRYLTWFAEDRAPMPGSSVCLALTSVLAQHWATGQSALEDQHLPALLSWIDPPDGMSGAEAALRAEDPDLVPPAGPTTDPAFDTGVLAPLVRAQEEARAAEDMRAVTKAEDELRVALAAQLEPTWQTVWRCIDVLREKPAAASDLLRWQVDRGRFTDFMTGIEEGVPPQPKRPSAVAAARRLADLESAQQSYDRTQAIDDPLVLARYRVGGEAFAGRVTFVDAERQEIKGKRAWPRPLVILHTDDEVILRPGARLASPARVTQTVRLRAVRPAEGGGYEVELELQSGMGRGKAPEEGSVPVVGEERCYATFLAEQRGTRPELPEADQTPWTHGGPPWPHVARAEDQTEEWQ